MPVFRPRSLTEALALLTEHPGAVPLAGGTDLMVAVNAGRHPVGTVIAVGRLPELQGWRLDGPEIVLGAGLTYAQLLDPALARRLPVLAQAARTVGSPPIRNAGTIGGNLATGSPAGDALPPLAVLDARVELASGSGTRTVPFIDFLLAPKTTARRPDELITAVRVTPPAGGGPTGEFLKVGTRNAMVIAVASVAAVVDRAGRTVRVALGSVAPTVRRAPLAEAFSAAALDWEGGGPAGPDTATRFGQLVAAAAEPIDDHRATAAYRRHAVSVLAARALRRLFPVPDGALRPSAA